MAAQVASLLIDISANVAKIQGDMNKAGRAVEKFGDTIKNVAKGFAAGFSVQQVVAYGESVLAAVDKMDDLAENLKIATTDFQAFESSALLAGQSMESVGTAIGKFNVFIGKAAEGSKEQIERLNELGVKILDVNGKVRPTADLLQEVAIAITKIADPARRAAAEVAIFGKSGQAISATLEQFAKGTTALNAELSALGLIHSPEVIKQISELNKQGDIAAKRMEVLFAPFYAAAKSAVLEIVAAGFQKIANAVTAIKAGDIEAIVRTMTALALIPTIVGAPLGVALLAGIKEPLQIVDEQIAKTQKTLEGLEGTIRSLHGTDKQGSAAAIAAAEKYRAEQQKLNNLYEQRSTLTGAVVSMTKPTGGAGSPTPKDTGGVDKYAEAMRKLKEETEATKAAIAEFNRLTAAGETGKEAAKQAKLIEDIGKARSKVITDIPKGVDPKPLQEMAEALVRLKFNLDKVQESQKVADGVHKEFGDGTRELRDRIDELNIAYVDGRIKAEEYAAAVEAAQKAQRKQSIQANMNKEGWEGFTAGVQNAQMQLEEYVKMSNQGSMAIMGVWNLASDALSEFITTGEMNFQKLAQGFAKMLADMVAKWLVAQAILGGIKLLSSAFGVSAPAVAPTTSMAPPGRAIGGPVMGGHAYTVGEHGPETFVPRMPGNIVPNGGGGDMKVVINNNAPATDVSASRDSDGNIAITVERVRRALTRDVQRGGNSFATSFERTYGIARGGA